MDACSGARAAGAGAVAAPLGPLRPLRVAALHWTGADRVKEIRASEENDDDDDDEAEYRVSVYGKAVVTPSSSSSPSSDSTSSACCCVHVPFRPYFYVEVGLRVTHAQLRGFEQELRRALGGGNGDWSKEYAGSTSLRGRSFLGYSSPDSSGFLKLCFRSLRACRKASSWIARTKPWLRLYESRVDPVIRFLHDAGISEPCCGFFATGSGGDRCIFLEVDTRRRFVDIEAEAETMCDVEVTVPQEALCQRRSDSETSGGSAGAMAIAAAAEGFANDADEKETAAATITVASFDVECYSASGEFPDASKPEDVIITICTVFTRVGGGEKKDACCYRKVAVFFGDVGDDNDEDEKAGRRSRNGIELVRCATEADVIAAWARELHEERIDVLVGYNIWGFDMQYIHRRAVINGGVMNPVLADFMRCLGRHRHGGRPGDPVIITSSADEVSSFTSSPSPSPITCTSFRVKGAGAQSTEAVTLPSRGVLQLDLLYFLRRFYPKLDSFKLDEVARVMLPSCGTDDNNNNNNDSNRKTGMSIRDMHALWRGDRTNYANKWPIVEYCVRDAELVARLLHELSALNTVLEMANVCGVPPATVVTQGEQIKVFSLILRKAREARMLCPTVAATTQSRSNQSRQSLPPVLQGATVLEPTVGAYWRPVVCLDFQSLYPSIMMAHNLCHSTVVDKNKGDGEGKKDVHESEVEGLRVTSRQRQVGVLPGLLAELQQKRAEAKAAMKRAQQAGDGYLSDVYNAKQLAYKVSMNAVYGFCGADVSSGGILPCPEVASAVTAVGRSMIRRTREFIEREFAGARVVYGDTDSVMVDFFSDNNDKVDVRRRDAVVLEAECREAERLGREAADRATALFPRPVKLCYEKCYLPFLLFSKKRYAGRCVDALDSFATTVATAAPKVPVDHEGDVDNIENIQNIEIKGVQFVRKDTCPFVKATCRRIMKCLLEEMDVDRAIHVARDAARTLLLSPSASSTAAAGTAATAATDDRTYAAFTLTSSIKCPARDLLCDVDQKCVRCGSSCVVVDEVDDNNNDNNPKNDGKLLRCTAGGCKHERTPAYKSFAAPGVQVACKMERRRPGGGPKAGEPVSFVYVVTSGSTSSRSGEAAEDANEARARGLAVDGRHYFEHQLKNVLVEVFALVLSSSRGVESHGMMMRKKDVERLLFAEIVAEHDARRSGQRLITHAFAPSHR